MEEISVTAADSESWCVQSSDDEFLLERSAEPSGEDSPVILLKSTNQLRSVITSLHR